jgi:RND family efflux transporter MFP subunit
MPGTVRAIEAADLYAKIGGHVASVEVDIGDEVRKGAVLARLHVPEMDRELEEARARIALARAERDQAVANLAQAEAGVLAAVAAQSRVQAERREREATVTLRRSERDRWVQILQESPAIEPRRLDEARFQLEAATAAVARSDAEVEAAEAEVVLARARVDKARADGTAAEARITAAEASAARLEAICEYREIVAPFDGVITARHLHPGAFIQPAASNSAASPILTIERIDRVRLVVDVAMDAVPRLDCGDRAVLERVRVAPGRKFEGVVTRLSQALDERSRMMRAEIELQNPVEPEVGRVLRPGSYGTVTILLEEHRGIPCIPASAVRVDGEASYVYVVEDGVCRRRVVERAFDDGIRLGIRAGLREGERIVVGGLETIADGQPVRDARPGAP